MSSEEDRKSIRDRAMLVKRQETASAVAQMRQRLRAMGVLQKVDVKEENPAPPPVDTKAAEIAPKKPSPPQEQAWVPPPLPPPTDSAPPPYIKHAEEAQSDHGEADDSLITATVLRLYASYVKAIIVHRRSQIHMTYMPKLKTTETF